jgi:ATP-dependent helicase HepA
MFVRARQGEFAALGVGKLLGAEQGRYLVEFFDAPFASPRVEAFDAAELGTVTLPQQTRVYCYDAARNVWGIGRLLDDHGDTQLVRLPNNKTELFEIANVYVRCDLPIVDPTPFLAAQITESPRFSEARRRFVGSLLSQRAASMGMAGLISSSIELEPHQIEVVRRVLQDPVQRFLLADEVGLGKTIEAGVLIRQCAIETNWNGRIVVLAPEALTAQWRHELKQKFGLEPALEKTIFVLSFDSPKLLHHLSRAAMLVIDEAHHLSSPAHSGLYGLIASMTPAIERLLLLSATPALHNERSFLEMLHLIDPETYQLDDEDAFRRRVAARGELADIVAMLNPQTALYVDQALDKLNALFPENVWLQNEVASLRALLATMPDEDAPELIEAMMRVRAHLCEVYRLDRRILRNRRNKVVGLTPGRAGALVADYPSRATAQLVDAIDAWRFEAAERPDAFQDQCTAFVEHSFSPGRGADQLEASRTSGNLARALGHSELFEARLEALTSALEREKLDHEQWVIFCSAHSAADAVAARLSAVGQWRVFRHDVHDGAWKAFMDDGEGAVLVCDRRAEEGLNLQGAQRWAVHFDLPLNPNRIEQRLGRLDRYGSGEAVRSLILRCVDNPYEVAWIEYLNATLRIFDRSVASLQYLIDATMRSLSKELLTEGTRALTDLTERGVGSEGEVERELKAIERQEDLDALTGPSAEQFGALFDTESAWSAIAEDCSAWLEDMLQLDRVPIEHGASDLNALFRYAYAYGARHTLMPLQTFHEACAAALQIDPMATKRVQTYPFSYRRQTTLNRKGRAVRARPLRYGETFIDGISAITARDDRGRQMAMWRHIASGYEPLGKADLFFRFDFIVECDVSEVEARLAARSVLSSVSSAAMRRRGDMALAPLLETIWLDGDLREVNDGQIQALLDAPYSDEARAQGGRDFNLNAQRWRVLRGLGLPELGYWQDLCERARAQAQFLLVEREALVAACSLAARRTKEADAGRLALLRARAERANAAANDVVVAQDEDALSLALIRGVQNPLARLESVSAVFLGADMSIANALASVR